MNIGERIKELRQKINMTQGELAKDICTQSFISRLEGGSVSPSAETVYRLSERLGVPISALINPAYNERYDYFSEVYKQLRNARAARDYDLVRKLIQSQKNNPLFKDIRYQKIFTWHESLCAFFIKNDLDQALALINSALEMSYSTKKNLSEEDLEILITKCNLLIEAKRYNEAQKEYQTVFSHLNQNLPLLNDKIVIRCYYNYAYVLYHTKKFNESIMYCNKGITYCTEHHYLYALGDLYFMLGRNFIKLHNKESAITHLQYAKMAYHLLKSEKNINMTQSLITQMKDA
ncbi:helix-turn-helix domain-containing protein [Rossellomorea sp. LjRoot5]|uniref:helix-turn-helix domain-containing protein n=1 Tax=Rossellomorea sp. LjRoot5 TaxID=3342331 RepID=UPI003ED0F238